jgi:hypothetical protein
MNNQESTKSWNFITYDAELLDSQMHDDFATGTETVVPDSITEAQNSETYQCIGLEKPGRQTRGLAARIVVYLAHDLNFSEFPGSLESISSLP